MVQQPALYGRMTSFSTWCLGWPLRRSGWKFSIKWLLTPRFYPIISFTSSSNEAIVCRAIINLKVKPMLPSSQWAQSTSVLGFRRCSVPWSEEGWKPRPFTEKTLSALPVPHAICIRILIAQDFKLCWWISNPCFQSSCFSWCLIFYAFRINSTTLHIYKVLSIALYSRGLEINRKRIFCSQRTFIAFLKCSFNLECYWIALLIYFIYSIFFSTRDYCIY